MKIPLRIKLLTLVLLLLVAGSAFSRDFIVLALFPGKAMIEFEGKRIFLKSGEEKKGFLLISTDPYEQTAVLEVEGKTETYTIGKHIGGGYTKPEVNEVRVNSNKQGSFLVNGQINGQGVNFLLDTGATSIAMNENLANRLKIDFVKENKKVTVATAAGQRDAYRVVLEKVSIGSITLYDIQGLVLRGDSPEIALLGMSFLGQLELEQNQNLMVLRKKF